MKSQVLANFHLPWLSCIALLLFLAVFIGSVIWIFRQGSRQFYQKMERLPLEEASS